MTASPDTASPDEDDGDAPLPAGALSTWLDQVQGALRGEHDSDVPCGTCTACCTSSQFVHIEPDETDALAHIPAALLFPAPRLPMGHVLLGYDERGHCPMLVDGRCSIYAHRPRTCRTYDCRVLTASGLGLDDEDRPAIAARARRWEFDLSTPRDRASHAAVRAAAALVTDDADALGDVDLPPGTTQRAVLAVAIHETFLGTDEHGEPVLVAPAIDEVRVAIGRRRR